MKNNRLQIEQLESRMKLFSKAKQTSNPSAGWIKTIRLALGITLKQLATKLSVSKQSVSEMERREKEGTITIKTLKETANALGMDFVYGLVPKEGTLENLIENKARLMAEKIVLRTAATMKLEDQENSKKRIKKAIEERTKSIIQTLPKALWD